MILISKVSVNIFFKNITTASFVIINFYTLSKYQFLICLSNFLFSQLRTFLNVDGYSCPLTKRIFQQPFIAADNNTYEKNAIQKWLQTNDKSPITGQKLSNKKLIPNYTTKAMIDFLKEQKSNIWQKLQENEKKFILLFGPKINKLLNEQIFQNQQKKASDLLGKWKQRNMEIQIQKSEQIIKRQADLSAYKLKIDKKNFQIPTLCDFHVERQAYLSLIQQSFCGSYVVCLIGFAGVGKSQIALQYILKQSKYENVIWLNGGHKNLYIIQIKKYLEATFKFSQQNFKTFEQMLRQFFRLVGQKGIVIFDNLQQKQIDSLFLQEFKGKILLTTRYKEWKFPTIQVKQLSENEAYIYLCESLKDKQITINKENAKILSELVCGIPLALSQTTSYLKQHPNIEEYIDIFKKTSGQLLKQVNDENSKNIYTSLILALHKTRKQNNQIDEILNAIGYFSNEHIKLNSIIQYFLFHNPKLSMKKIKRKIKRSLISLRNYSLLTSGEKQDQYKINNITQSLIRLIHKRTHTYNQNMKNIIQWLVSIIQNILGGKVKLGISEIQSKVTNIKGSTTHSNINHKNENILQFFYNYAHIINIADLDTTKEVKTYLTKIKKSFSKLINFFQVKDYKIQMKFLFTTLHDINKNKFGQQNLLTKISKISKGWTEHLAGENQKAISTLQQSLKFNNPGQQIPKFFQANALLLLSDAYFDKGINQKGFEYKEKSLQTFNQHYPDQQLQKMIKNSLAFNYYKIGNYQKSINITLDLLKIQEQQQGNNNQIIGTLSILANMYCQINDFQNQRNCLQRALKIQQQEHKEDNINIIHILTALATLQNKEKNHQKKKRLLQRAVALSIKLFGPQHIKTIQLKVKLAETLENFSQKKQQLEKLIPILINYYGENRLIVFLAHLFLANALLGLGNFVQLEILSKKRLKIARKLKIPQIISPWNRFIQFIQQIKNNKYSNSQLHFQKLLFRDPNIVKVFDRQIDYCVQKFILAKYFIQNNINTEMSIQLLKDCEIFFLKYFGEESQLLADVYKLSSKAYAEIKYYSQAKQIILKCINLYIQLIGEIGNNLNIPYDQLKEYQKNLNEMKESYKNLSEMKESYKNLSEMKESYKISFKVLYFIAIYFQQFSQLSLKSKFYLIDFFNNLLMYHERQTVNNSNLTKQLATKYHRQGVQYEQPASEVFESPISLYKKQSQPVREDQSSAVKFIFQEFLGFLKYLQKNQEQISKIIKDEIKTITIQINHINIQPQIEQLKNQQISIRMICVVLAVQNKIKQIAPKLI